MKITATEIRKELKKLASVKAARLALRFFKTGAGQYGEGDRFLGVTVPSLRVIAGKYRAMPLAQILPLLRSRFHEERMLALLLLVQKSAAGSEGEKSKIYRLYLANTKYVNNWDLVDTSAAFIVGAYLAEKDKQPLYKLARSKSMWERRISIIATLHLIRNNDFRDALAISLILKNDKEDLIHKAVGWMLREVGNRCLAAEEKFLKQHYQHMPRTMLRYAIEKFPAKKRRAYLAGGV